MSDRKKTNDSDNENTSTTYIPQDIREQYRQSRRKTTSPPQYPNQQQNQPYQGQQYPNQQQYQPYQGQQYPNQQQYQPYQGQQYPNQQQYQPYQGQQYPNQQQNQPYQGQQYPNQQQYQQSQQYSERQPQPRPAQPKRKTQKKKPSPNPPAQKKKSKKKKRKSVFSRVIGRFLFILLVIFLLLFGIYSCTAYKLIDKMDYTESGSRSRTAGALSENYVKSVLLIGTDGRTESDRGRSDTMILLSMNSSTDTINLTSFMRDCYVEIPEYGWDKLNAAYSYGGAELLMDTIEHNFGIKIDDYISVNFVSFANIVDSVDGIDIDISDAEAQEINTIMQAEVNSLMGDDIFSDLLSGGGKLHLNGKQALSYARIRYVGNADFERTERQRRVMELVIDKVKSFSAKTINNISETVLPDVSTNMTAGELYILSLRVPFLAGYETEQLQIPVDGTYYGEYTSSGDALIVDFDANYSIIKDKVFSE